MKSTYNLSEEQRMHIVAIISSIPRGNLEDFKKSTSGLNTEELKYLKQNLSFLVTKGQKQYLSALNSL